MANTDETIQRDALDEMKWDMRIQPNEIGVAVKDGVVTLTGTVDTYVKKQAAVQAAERVRGVKAVANDLQVRLPGMGERTDTDLARAAREALKWDSEAPSDAVKIAVSDGLVTLEGEVESGFQKRAAEHAVYRLAGVKGVANLLIVRPRVTAGEFRQDIEKALVRNARTDAQHINVEVEGSTVILRGTVASVAEKEAAEDTAWAEPGVSEVENFIVVS